MKFLRKVSTVRSKITVIRFFLEADENAFGAST